jgi:hypothetical protein
MLAAGYVPGPMASRVLLPPGVRSPFTVFVNGVRQQPGRDYDVTDGAIVFRAELVQEGRLGFWKWTRGAFGIGTYARNDVIDVAWEADGAPRLAHGLPLTPER